MKLKFRRSLLLLLLAVAFCCLAESYVLAADAVTTVNDLFPIRKENYPAEDSVEMFIPPNVLFLLDVGSPMTFSPKGTMPLETVGTPQERANMYKECTYGTGARPLSVQSSSGSVTEQPSGNSDLYSRFGRDTNGTNNVIGDAECYYSTNPSKPYFLTFKNSVLANWNGQASSLPSDNAVANANTDPIPSRVYTELKKYIPGIGDADKIGTAITESTKVTWTEANVDSKGNSTPQTYSYDLIEFLVPNDSRMYQMKLVLAKLLQDKENQDTLTNMKIAMATSYFESHYGTRMSADFLKRYPYGRTSAFPYGVGPKWSSGLSDSVGYVDAQASYAGINRELYDSNGVNWTRVNRSIMQIPFDFLYKYSDDGSRIDAQPNLDSFLSYIDGVESVSATSNGQLRAPELLADGKTPLSMAIYGRGQTDYSDKPAHVDSAGAIRHTTSTGGSRPTTSNPAIRYAAEQAGWTTNFSAGNNVTLQNYETSEGLRAGMAVGSAIDFFSPYYKKIGNTVHGLTFTDNHKNTGNTTDTSGYFPIVGNCQKNWVVVFTAANDSDGINGEEGVKRLFMNSVGRVLEDGSVQELRGRKYNQGDDSWEVADYAMMDGIRTLVVGFVDKDDPGSATLVTELTNMAQWGDPVYVNGEWVKNTEAEPYFANDVDQLIKALTNVMMRINNDRFTASAPVMLPTLEIADGAGDAVMYSPSYTVNRFDQWEGFFTKTRLTRAKDDEGEETGEEEAADIWEFSDRLAAAASGRSSRIYTVPDGSTTVTTLDEVKDADVFGDNIVETQHIDTFKGWLTNNNGKTGHLLGDMEASGFNVVVDDDGKRTVYLQTNRGFLHAIRDSDEGGSTPAGSEKWAFMPPNILQGRAQAMKFANGSYLGVSSFAMNLLDGALVSAKVALNADNPEVITTLLMGNLGWGGNGMYMMDVTDNSTPKFLWAVDNARYAATGPVKRWGKAVDAANYDYSSLGLTIAPPVFSKVKESVDDTAKYVGILPGGLGYRLGKDGDNQGKAIYVFDPANANIYRKLTELTNTGSLGMVVAPGTFVRNSSGNMTSFYTADSNGNVLFCDTNEKEFANWGLKSLFQLVQTRDIKIKDTNDEDIIISSSGTPISIPKALTVADAPFNKGRWVFGGTANLKVPNYSEDRKGLINSQQYIFGVNTKHVSGDVTSLHDKVVELVYEADTAGNYGNGGTSEGISDSDWGWYLPLALEDSGKAEAEYVTTSPYLYQGILYVATFIPKIPEKSGSAKVLECDRVGHSKIYAFDPLTGAGAWEYEELDEDGNPILGDDGKPKIGNAQSVTMKDAKITGITAFGGKLYIGFKAFSKQVGVGDNVDDILKGKLTMLEGSESSLASIEVPVAGSGDTPWEAGIPYLNYWMDVF